MIRALRECKDSLNLGQIKVKFAEWLNNNQDFSSKNIRETFVQCLTVDSHFKKINAINNSCENNNCLVRLLPFAIYCSRLQSNDDLFEAVRLYCSFTHVN